MQDNQSQWPGINPGDIRHPIQIQSASSTQDEFGEPLQAWTTIRTTRGGINLVSMREVFGAGQFTSQSTDIWTIRWNGGVTIQPGMQIVFGPSTYKIQAISNVQKRNVLLHILCLELNATSGTA